MIFPISDSTLCWEAPLNELALRITSSASAGPANGAQKLLFSSVSFAAVDEALAPICMVRAVIKSVALTVAPDLGFSIFPVKTGIPFEKTILSWRHSLSLAIWVATSLSGTVALSFSAIHSTSSFETSGRPSFIVLLRRWKVLRRLRRDLLALSSFLSSTMLALSDIM